MALTEELKRLYSSNPVDIRYYDTVELSHSLFSQTFYMVKDTEEHTWDIDVGGVPTPVLFKPFPFNVVLPEVGGPQQDLSFVWDNAGREAMPELEAASALITEPIKLVYRVYVDGFSESQIYPIPLVLTDITADHKQLSAMATRPSLFKRKIPTGNFASFDSRFKGLIK